MNDLLAALRSVPVRYHVLAGVSGLLVLVLGSSTVWAAGLAPAEGLAVLALLVMTAAPVVALWRPWWALLPTLLLPVPVVLMTGEVPFVLIVSLAAAGVVATRTSRRRGAVLCAAAVLPAVVYATGRATLVLPYNASVDASYRADDPVSVAQEIGAYAAGVLVVYGLGLLLRRLTGLEARAGEVERESAVVTERARLARDLHDVVAHHVSLIAVRAETAPYTVPDLSPGAQAVLTEIAEDSRRALAELRGVLGILRRSTEDPELAPQPSAADIPTLVAEARAAGDPVDDTAAAVDLSGVRAPAGYVAYRVVQESLTNARRHAPGSPVRVEAVADASGGVLVRVSNALPDGAPDGPVAEGRGLTGMRERVGALGGTLVAERRAAELVVEAQIPGGAA